MKHYRRVLGAVALMGGVGLWAGTADALQIDNGVAITTVGYWAVDVLDGGESRQANMTAVGTPSGTVHQDIDVVYDYFSYVDIGGGGVRLSASTTTPVASTGPNETTSSGSFTGANGNAIGWTAVSSIAAASNTMQTVFTFTAATGTLGNLRFYQYLDEDVLGADDDVFFTRGTTLGDDLELYTIDNAESVGVSQSGVLSAGSGLQGANFSGWAACVYDDMRPAIGNGTQAVSPTGTICATLAGMSINHPQVGPALGPDDIVTTLAWDVNPAATQVTITTSLGGVPDITVITPDYPPILPEPAPAVSLWGMGGLTLLVVAIGAVRSRRRRGED